MAEKLYDVKIDNITILKAVDLESAKQFVEGYEEEAKEYRICSIVTSKGKKWILSNVKFVIA